MDWVMYNPNYDTYIYSVVQFHFAPNGYYDFITFNETFSVEEATVTWYIMFLVFMVLFIYYIISDIRSVIEQWQ